MNWQPLSRRHSWNRKDGYELRLTSKTIGYLNANAREFLFGGSRAGVVRFEREGGNGTMSVVAAPKGVKVNQHGHLSVSTLTSQTQVALPITVMLLPFEDEKRLLFAGVK